MPTNNSYNTAQDLGVLNGSIAPIANFVGTNDREDFFRFTLTQNSDVTFDLTGLSEPAQLDLTADLNGNGVYTTDEIIQRDGINPFSSNTEDRNITQTLPPGTYWIRTSTNNPNRNTNYTLSATATPAAAVSPDPGENYTTARNIGPLGALQTFSDAVGSLDRIDQYQFTVDQNSQVFLTLTGLSEAAQLYLVADLDGDGVYDPDERIEDDDVNPFSSSTEDRGIVKTIVPGTYWIQVETQQEDDNTGYTISASATSVPTLPTDPGSDLISLVGVARNIGNLSTQQTFQDAVGSLDQFDYYQFTLTQNADVTLNLSGLSEAAQLSLLSDIDGNGVISLFEEIADDGVNPFSDSTEDRGIVESLAAGTYVIGVVTTDEDDNTGYTLTVSSTAPDIGGAIPPNFDADDYLASNPDLIFAFGYNLQAATEHYQNFGQAEGRPIDNFAEDQYLASYPDLQAVFGNDLAAATRHYIESGVFEGRDPLVGFDGAAYIASYDDLINAFGFDPNAGREHFRNSGLQEGRTITFDPFQYIASYGDLIQAFGLNADAATAHFITNGQAEGRSRDDFSAETYLSLNPDLAFFGNDLNAATQHYIQFGFNEGRAIA